MSAVLTRPVGSLTSIRTGKLDANAADPNGRYPFFTCSREPLSINTFSYEGNAVLIAGNGDLNVKHYRGKFDAYQRTYIVESRDEKELDTRYLFWFMDKYVERLRELSIGGVIKYIKLGMLADAEIPLPALSEQKRIAAILDKADAIRRKRQQAIQLADEFLRSVFLDMFGDPITNPKGWEIQKLKDISSRIHSGSTPKGGSKVYVDKGIMFLRSQNVWRNNLVLDDVVYIDEAIHKEMNKSSLKNKDILITKTGRFNTENSSLGRAAMYLGEDDAANVNGHVYLVRLTKDVVNEFVLHILTTKEYREYIRRVCVGGIDKRQINKEHLENFPIIYPPIKLQEQFAHIIKVHAAQKTRVDASFMSAERLFNALAQRAFRGEL